MDNLTYAYVGLLDVIGYRNRLTEDREKGILSFKDNLQNAMAVFQTVNEADFQYQAISDTIIISCSKRNEFLNLLFLLKKVYIAFLGQGLFIRGGIAYSQHFKSSHVTYSHAIALAYEIESKNAIFPRIVIDKNVIEMQKALKIRFSEDNLIAQCNSIYFLNIVDHENWQTIYELSRSMYERDKDNIKGDEKAFLKHLWFQDYILNHPFARENGKAYIEGMKLMSEKE